MLHLERCDSSHPDFQLLVAQLDRYLEGVNGDANDFFAPFNVIDTIRNVVVAYSGETPVGCGAFKPWDEDTAEIKRMYVQPEFRGQGVAKSVLSQLENWAAELGYHTCILETAKTMTDAVGLYQRCGYSVVPNYGQYAGVESSVCMQKNLNL